MSAVVGLNKIETSLRSKIKFYKKKAQKFEQYLEKHPDKWGKFQSEFNAEVNGIFREIMEFEKINLAKGNEDKVYKLKLFFIEKLRLAFVRGNYAEWSLSKPLGYSGDFKIIDDIYLNNPTTKGYERLFDNYFQMSAISVAVRNRKEDCKRFLAGFIFENKKRKLRIMDLASGPCRDLKELLSFDKVFFEKTIFDCYDNDKRAIKYGQELLSGYKNINFFQENAVRLGLKKDITSIVNKKYDCIFSTGLFDYFNEKFSTRLVDNLKQILMPGGKIFIASVRDKYSNPSARHMEWISDWNLVYRDEEEFTRIFTGAGFSEEVINIRYEQQGIMQYAIICSK